ncbi:hypothetical protein ECEC1845_1826 [Escherichia coli EC1845]|uniref:Uncharacterized protein n=1 Tax=Escherichia coli O157:H7 (strain EC869) TaxID=478008 RepID=A0A0H3PGZ1_ECO5C|nr:hypothetical protein ECH74115_1753 [Escherichia coli O157:H7 str. EC4115]EDU67499.1 hypothetical protein ECH7EC4076_3979 [Escherichia coli O157:H7 str. EC4076]EDU88427.1 hypothetical protein ECH7EC869_0010 [Escherichia coli O157:H7 str. EC869]EEC27101.1 hypothetical protein ESCCO14588_3227 [Escherichia coli O157:H7 str. TW14588]EFW64489.1 hypothetical protein ECoD_03485 [Escherichia coli O157:H7 str. EC1212]EHU73503.1 hypothetical protein ECDEC3C_2196 [Escherichia coli DEC3C]EHU78982.1 hyp
MKQLFLIFCQIDWLIIWDRFAWLLIFISKKKPSRRALKRLAQCE